MVTKLPGVTTAESRAIPVQDSTGRGAGLTSTDANSKTSGRDSDGSPGDTWVVVLLQDGQETDWYKSTVKARSVNMLGRARNLYPERKWRFDRLVREKDVPADA
jgi:hypothetical protein